MNQQNESYAMFRKLTSPIVALTCAWQGKLNGMVLNSAIRASLIPSVPRVAVFVLKRNFSHEMIFQSGAFALHLLHSENWDLIWELGFHSGREREKLLSVKHTIGESGSPLLNDCYARFDCRVINAMDTGASTCFLGEALSVERGQGDTLMTSRYFRERMPADWHTVYEANLATAQEWAAGLAEDIHPLVWRGLPTGDR